MNDVKQRDQKAERVKVPQQSEAYPLTCMNPLSFAPDTGEVSDVEEFNNIIVKHFLDTLVEIAMSVDSRIVADGNNEPQEVT